MRGVIHIDEVAQIAVVVDKRALRISRSLVPEDVDVAEAVLRPHIEFRSVSRGCLQGLPFGRVKHGLTFQSNGAVLRMDSPLSIRLDGLGWFVPALKHEEQALASMPELARDAPTSGSVASDEHQSRGCDKLPIIGQMVGSRLYMSRVVP